MARTLSLVFLACVSIVGVLSQGAPQTLVPNDQYEFFQWTTGTLPADTTPQFSVTFPESGFITISDFQCPGDEFTLYVNNQNAGKTSAPLIRTCGIFNIDWLETVRDPRYSSGRFYVPAAGTYTLKVAVNPLSFISGNGVIKARTAVCQGPPTLVSDDFALVSRLVPGDSAAKTCKAFGFELADITSSNVGLAAQTANYCLSVMKADTQTQVFVNSWNTDTYGGTLLGLYLARSAPTYGNVLGSDGAHHYTLCQKSRTSSVVGNPTTCDVSARSGSLALVRPIGLSKDIIRACGCAGLIPAVLSGARPEEFLAATTLVFTNVGINGRAWIGGWEVATSPNNYNQNLALHAGSGAPGGSINVPVPDPAVPGMLKLAYLCTAPSSYTPHKRAAKDEL